MSDRYDMRPLRDWYLANNPNLTHACEALGYMRGAKPDQSRILRCLGLKSEKGHTQKWMGYEQAVKVARALGADPVDVNL